MRNLVAVIPPPKLINFLERSATLVYAGTKPSGGEVNAILLEDLPKQPDYEWVVAFEEVARFDERLNPEALTFIELRDLLHGECTKSDYCGTLR